MSKLCYYIGTLEVSSDGYAVLAGITREAQNNPQLLLLLSFVVFLETYLSDLNKFQYPYLVQSLAWSQL